MSTRLLRMTAVAAALGIGLIFVIRSFNRPPGRQTVIFTRVGQNGPVFTVSVPRAKAADDDYLMAVAGQLSAESVQAGGSGQISVMVWPDEVAVPKEPPTTEFDASMKTQIAGIFINPARNIRHLIRFRDGVTVSEKDFGVQTR